MDSDSNVIVESKDVEFIKNNFYNDSKSTPTHTMEQITNPSPFIENRNKINDFPSEPRRSQRIRKAKDFGSNFIFS